MDFFFAWVHPSSSLTPCALFMNFSKFSIGSLPARVWVGGAQAVAADTKVPWLQGEHPASSYADTPFFPGSPVVALCCGVNPSPEIADANETAFGETALGGFGSATFIRGGALPLPRPPCIKKLFSSARGSVWRELAMASSAPDAPLVDA